MRIKSKFIRNLFYRWKGFKEIKETAEFFLCKCLKCEAVLKVHKFYGNLHVVCECGNSADIYTGDNIHKKEEKTLKKSLASQDTRGAKLEIFERNILSDLICLSDSLCSKRDIREQQVFSKYDKMIKQYGSKTGCERMLRQLQNFCDLSDSQIRLTWEQLKSESSLRAKSNSVSVLGTTYAIPMGQKVFYTIYINQEILHDRRLTAATIAHELSHVYAHSNGLKFLSPNDDRGDNEYSEQMTDLLGIALGVGSLLCDPSFSEEPTDTGYLSSELIFEAHQYWVSKILSGKTPGIKTSIKCPRCAQRLRVPISNKKLKLVCPKCSNRLIVGSMEEMGV